MELEVFARLPLAAGSPTVDELDLLLTVAAARDHERPRFDYRGHDGNSSRRTVEPHRLVHTWGRWYLIAWDVDRADWRTFRADRIEPRIPTGPRFTPRELPGDGDLAHYVTAGLGTAMWRYRATVTVYAPADRIAARLPRAIKVTAIDENTCMIDVGSDTPQMLAVYLGMLDADFEAHEPPELVAHLRTTAKRYLKTTRHSGRLDRRVGR